MAVAQLGGKPILVLPEGSRRLVGRDARRMNIMAARVVAEAVKTTLGPKGMDKMMVDNLGDVVITNDGATILKEMDVEHPAAKMMVEVAKTQDDEAGDGTTTAVVLAGAMLEEAEKLLDQGIHPTIISRGFMLAASKAQELLKQFADPISPDDEALLKNIAITAMTGKKAESEKMHLAELVVKAVKRIADRYDGGYKVDIDYIGVEKRPGGSIRDSELIEGVIIDKEVVRPGMPKLVRNAKIALLDCALEVKKTETDAEIRVARPEQLTSFLEEEERILKNMVEKIAATGANVVFCQKGIDDTAQYYLAKAGIMAARRVKKSDMEKLARATGGKIVTSLEDLTPAELGHAGLVEERKIGEEKLIFVMECKDPKAVGILLRGGSEHVVDEVERAVHDSLCVVAAAVEDRKLLVGGGAMEIELAKHLRKYSETVGAREALAVRAYADALEVIPQALATNAGMDAVSTLVELRAAHARPEGKYMGVDVFGGKVADMRELNVYEPLRVKLQAIKSATDAAVMILRIDDVIAAAKKELKGPPEKEKKEEEEGGTGGGEFD
ncbi:MAG: thermosome subunit beta [Candidatus Hadarchaeales archaeon]